ncbi:carboxypeptidase regulatory-like domain-containing protein [bacterium]|nr:carboxypeptidase regulatory-like domain-containing protein [bacterium]
MMKKKDETKVFNPFLLILAMVMAVGAVAVGYWLMRSPTAPVPARGPVIEFVEKQKKSEKQDEIQPSSPPVVQKEPEKETEAPTTASYSGRVVEISGEKTVSGSTVRASSPGRPPRDAISGQQGEFFFDSLPPGSWTFRAAREGYAAVMAETCGDHRQLSAGEKFQGAVLKLAPPATLEGKVLSFIGKEIPGATVQVYEGRNSAGIRVTGLNGPGMDNAGKKQLSLLSVGSALATVQTDAKGAFRFDNLEAGVYSLVAYATGFSRKTSLMARTGTSDTVFRLEPEVRVSGMVLLSPAGSGIPGASIAVTLQSKEFPLMFGEVIASQTGYYRIGGLPRRFTLSLQAFHKESESVPYELSISGGISHHKKDLLVFTERKITGRIVETSSKQPVEGVQISLQNRLQPITEAGATDAQGAFQISTRVVNNTLTFKKDPHFQELVLPADFEGDESVLDLGDIPMISGVSLSGRVVNDQTKAGVGPGVIRAIPVDKPTATDAEIPADKADSGGTFTLKFVPAGRYYLSAEIQGYKAGYYGDPKPATEGAHPILTVQPFRDLSSLQIPVTAGPSAAIQGIVVDATGNGIPGTRVQLQPLEMDQSRSTQSSNQSSLRVTSAEDGKFMFKEAPYGRYTLVAEKEGFWPGGVESVFVGMKSANPEYRIILEQANPTEISGQVADMDGNPLPGAEVGAFWGRLEALIAGGILTDDLLLSGRDLGSLGQEQLASWKGSGVFQSVKTQGDGSYRLEGLREGVYTVVAVHEKSGASDLLFDVEGGSTQVNFQLDANAGLSGIVTMPDGRTPCQSFSIQVIPTAETGLLDGSSSRTVRGTFQSQDGAFDLHGLAAGLYTLNVRSEGIGEASVAVEIVRGAETPDLHITLNNGGSISGRVASSDGSPISDAFVSLGNLSRSVGPDGSFTFLGLPPDRYAMVVHHEGHAPTLIPNIAVAPQNPVDLGVIVLSQGGSIEGTVGFVNGAGAMGYKIKAEPIGGRIDPRMLEDLVCRSDGNGSFKIPKVGPGHYRLTLRAPGGSTDRVQSGYGRVLLSRNVSVNEGQPTVVHLSVDSGVRMSGKVTLNGKPLSQSTVVLYPRFATEVTDFMAVTDPWGNYSFEGLPAGSYEAVVAAFSAEDEKSVTLTVPSQPTFEQNFDL